MPPKGKHKNISALAKAVKTQRHAAPSPIDANTMFVDINKSAAMPEFVIEEIGVGSQGLGQKKASTKTGMKTALGGESCINIVHRLRNAAVPIGCSLEDDCTVEEDLSMQSFDLSSSLKHLMPRRPNWSYEVSSGRLHFRESQMFTEWLDDVRQRIAARGGYPPAFEQNLQVWRQLWRVLERCDVAVVVLDSRHPLLHLPPALVFHVVKTLRKPMVLILNKLDVVDANAAKQWAEILQSQVPGVMGVVGYSKESLKEGDFAPLQIGKAALIAACHDAVDAARKGEVSADSGPTPRSAAEAISKARALAKAAGVEEPWIEEMEGIEYVPAEREDGDDGRILLGLIGHPNVGKSSIVNSLMGDKVVSVRATPGHTKTLQTINLDARTCLCDSPGVVFPRLEVPREAQIVGMLIPHGQVREPFSSIRWVMERATTPLQELLNLKPLTLKQVIAFQEAGTDVLRLSSLDRELDADDFVPWSPMLICAQYASQRGLVRSGRPDCMAAGLEILLRVLEGRVPYSVVPPAAEDEAQTTTRRVPGHDSDEDFSDWGIDDEDYESEKEIDPSQMPKDLLDMFGEDRRQVGQNTCASRRRQKRQAKLQALADGTSTKPEPPRRRKAPAEEE